MKGGNLTFFELFEVFRKTHIAIKFETRQGETFVEVDKSGTLMVSRK